MKNIEKIKQMNVEELAEAISYSNSCCRCCAYREDSSCVDDKIKSCKIGIKTWLNSEVRE